MDKPHMTILTPSKDQPAIARVVLAHGAGAGMDADFMALMANQLADQQIEVIRFNFPYMQLVSETGKRRPPDRMPKLLGAFAQMLMDIAPLPPLPLFIAGKSMGGRVATILAAGLAGQSSQFRLANADQLPAINGVIPLGYPFHPPGKADKLRIEHLPDITLPCLIIQGERDTLGNQSEIASYHLPEAIKVVYLPDGDHSFKPRKASGVTLADNLNSAVLHMTGFIKDNVRR